MGLFSSTRQPHTRCALRYTAAGRQRGGSGVEGTGVEWSGGEGREGEGRAGQGRVPDCLGGLSRVGISSRSTRPWNGQPPSIYYHLLCHWLHLRWHDYLPLLVPSLVMT